MKLGMPVLRLAVLRPAVLRCALLSAAALSVVACGGETAPAASDPGAAASAGAMPEQAAGPEATAPAGGAAASTIKLIPSPSWMPADWDQNVFTGAEYAATQPVDDLQKWRQQMIFTAPMTLWAVANDTLVDEKFEPIWVWWTALRSCEKGIQMTEDLAGEFGDRARGKAALTTARNELKAWAATQPKEITLYFTATLGQWNETTGNFPMHGFSNATTIRTKDAATFDPFFDGATVEAGSNAQGITNINHFQASLRAPDCVSADGKMVYKFEKMSQWWVVFGDVDRGAGGLANYKSRESFPEFKMTREQAAALAQRNPERKVEIAATFVPVGSSFVKGIDQSAIRAKFTTVTITDALDGSVLATKTY